MIEVVGKGGITARLIAHSVSAITGKMIATFEVEFPRFILSEYNTHRAFSRNAASTRAIPVLTQLANILDNPAMPIFYGKNQSGMVAEEELPDGVVDEAEQIILDMLDFCIAGVEKLNSLGLHKQHAGRYLEPWMFVKGVITSTEFDNFFHLRLHPDAQPEIMELARVMYEALQQSEPVVLNPGEWHVPYVNFDVISRGYFIDLGQNYNQQWLTEDDAIKISASCCAQVSYRKSDDSLEKALMVYDRLVNSKPVHASPFEHQATPMEDEDVLYWWNIAGITHTDRNGRLWSGNFCGWIQHRQLIEDNVCNDFKKEE